MHQALAQTKYEAVIFICIIPPIEIIRIESDRSYLQLWHLSIVIMISNDLFLINWCHLENCESSIWNDLEKNCKNSKIE